MRKYLLVAAVLSLVAILAKSWIFALAVRPHLADPSGVPLGLSLLLVSPFVIAGCLIVVWANTWRQLLGSALVAALVGPLLLAVTPGWGVTSLSQQLAYVATVWAATSVPSMVAGWVLGASVAFTLYRRIPRGRAGGSLGVV